MGGHKTTQNQRQLENVDRTVAEEVTGIRPYQEQFGKDYNTLRAIYGARIAQPLQLQTAPLFSTTYDPIVQQGLSQGIQAIQGQRSAANRTLAEQLGVAGTGNNAALLAALQGQSAFGGAGAMNALYPAALQQQREFDVQRQNLLQALNAQTMAARAQSINELAGGQQLLNSLQGMAGISAGRKQRTVGVGGTQGTTRQNKSWY